MSSTGAGAGRHPGPGGPDPLLDEPVWCVVNWNTGARHGYIGTTGWRLDHARHMQNCRPVGDWRVARWDDGRWVEAPDPEPEPVTARDVIAEDVAVSSDRPTGSKHYARADVILTALADAGFRVVRCGPDELPVVLGRDTAEAYGTTAYPPILEHARTLVDACRAALDGEGE